METARAFTGPKSRGHPRYCTPTDPAPAVNIRRLSAPLRELAICEVSRAWIPKGGISRGIRIVVAIRVGRCRRKAMNPQRARNMSVDIRCEAHSAPEPRAFDRVCMLPGLFKLLSGAA